MKWIIFARNEIYSYQRNIIHLMNYNIVHESLYHKAFDYIKVPWLELIIFFLKFEIFSREEMATQFCYSLFSIWTCGEVSIPFYLDNFLGMRMGTLEEKSLNIIIFIFIILSNIIHLWIVQKWQWSARNKSKISPYTFGTKLISLFWICQFSCWHWGTVLLFL